MSNHELLQALTPREKEILCLIAEGDSLLEIAQKLHRSQKTIESHRLSLGRKLKASNRVELTKIAIAGGLISLDDEQSDPNASRLQLKQTHAELELDWLEQINDAIANSSGSVLLERFCTAASRLPGVDIAAVCTPERGPDGEPIPYNRVIMAISEHGKLRTPMRYHAAKTPCQDVIHKGECCIASNVRENYPDDAWLAQVEAESYVGVMLLNALGQSVGGVAFIGRKPMEKLQEIRDVIEFFAPRLASALEVYEEINELRSQVDNLESEMLNIGSDALASTLDDATRPAVDVLVEVMRRVQPLAGAPFLRGIVDAMAEIFDLSHAGICRIDPAAVSPTLRSVIFCVDDEATDTIEYLVSGTPCEIVLENGDYFISKGAGVSFPKDEMLIKSQIDSYIGIRMPGSGGMPPGLFWMGRRGPIQNPQLILQIAKYFAPRIGAELANQYQFDLLLQDHERLEQVIANTASRR